MSTGILEQSTELKDVARMATDIVVDFSPPDTNRPTSPIAGQKSVGIQDESAGKEFSTAWNQEKARSKQLFMQPPTQGNHWEKCLQAVEKHDNEMCKSYREEIDTLLVFTGLFTAIVTAFTIESYRWLVPDPTDTTNQLLLSISQQLNGPVVSSLPDTPFFVPAYAIRINACWFLPITISLAAAVTGILCKQWMREFQRDAALPAKESLALRQMRYLGWKRWGVPHLISTPAILLQVSLLLFLTGLVDLLWTKVHCIPVAASATAVVGVTAAAMGLTTIMPVLYFLWQPRIFETGISYPCPYKSPQSHLLLQAYGLLYRFVGVFRKMRPFNVKNWQWLQLERYHLRRVVRRCGRLGGEASVRYVSLAMQWIQQTLAYNHHVRDNLFHCLQDMRCDCPARNCQHILFIESKADCLAESEDHPDLQLAKLMQENRALSAELVLRAHLAGVPKPQPNKVLNSVRFVSYRETIPPPLARLVLEYASIIIENTAIDDLPSGLWPAIFSLPMHQPTSYDHELGELFKLFHQALRRAEEDGGGQRAKTHFAESFYEFWKTHSQSNADFRSDFDARGLHSLVILLDACRFSEEDPSESLPPSSDAASSYLAPSMM